MTEFKVGDRVRRKWGTCKGQEPGYEGVINRISPGKLHFPDDTWGLAERFELVGPVVTETVTKTRIVPGTYGRLAVSHTYATEPSVGIKLVDRNGKELGVNGAGMTADELDAAAAVLSALAKGLRDA